MAWGWFLIGVISILLVLYPYIIYPIILSFLPAKQNTTDDGQTDEPLKVALLFCAYNEESELPEKIENIKLLKNICPQLEVYAYSDASSDATNDILINASDVLHPVIGKKRLGKILGMKKLVALAKAEILVFTDANVMLEPESLPKLLEYFQDPEIGCVSGKLLYKGIDSTTAKVGGIYWKLEEKIKQLETKTGSIMGADGSIFARRKEHYPEIPPNLVDDMAVSMAVIFKNKRCISAPDVIAYENAVSSSSEEFARKKRIACGSYSTYLYQRKELKKMSMLNRFKYVSHKLIRWWGALFILTGILSFMLWGFSIGIGAPLATIIIVALGLMVVFGKMGLPGISPLYEIFLAIIATGIGVFEALTGGDYQTWETSDTR